jgi:hypothetical protein
MLSTIVLSVLVISMLGSLSILPVKAQPPLDIINPGTDGYPLKWTAGPADTIGTNNFIFSSATTGSGSTFFINMTVSGVTALFGWGVGVVYDTTQLEYVSAWRPSDDVFAFAVANGWTIIAPSPVVEPVDPTHNIIKWGATYIMGDPEQTFSGTGVIGQIQFRIIATVDALHPTVSSTIYFDPAWTAFYYWPSGTEVPVLGTANFVYNYAAPTTLPTVYVKPATYLASALGEDVAIEVWVRDVAPGWSIVGFQFALWFNTTMLQDVEPWEVGPWMSTFLDGGETLISTATHDYLGIDPMLPLNYNKWMAFIAIAPDAGTWIPPFPSVGPEGAMLFRFHHTAVYETLFPIEAWTTLELHDVKAFDAFGLEVPIAGVENGLYRAPMKRLGLVIDEYTQYPDPYGGQGPNMPSDMFAPQAEVCLFAQVLYNGDPVQQKLVAFQVTHGDINIYREDFTDENGIASVCFRIPWPCVDPAGQILGLWTEISTVEVAEQIANDTLSWMVWWPVEVVSVTAKASDYIKDKTGTMPNMEFTVEYRTMSMQLIPVLLTVEVYDELGYHIGSAVFATTVGWGEYHVPLEFKNYTADFVVPMPTNAAVGTATVYANAFSDYPWNGGVPYCPEAYNTFQIKLPA